MPSVKQIAYIKSLLDQAGYGSRFMNAKFKELGASMRERSGSVDGWLQKMSGHEASKLIDTLKAKVS